MRGNLGMFGGIVLVSKAMWLEGQDWVAMVGVGWGGREGVSQGPHFSLAGPQRWEAQR